MVGVVSKQSLAIVFFIFCFTDFFRNKDEIKIKIKVIQIIFQLN